MEEPVAQVVDIIRLVEENLSASSVRCQELVKLVADTLDDNDRLRQAVDSLKTEFGELRRSVKYVLFDLEATRRENGYLRQMLSDDGDERHDDD